MEQVGRVNRVGTGWRSLAPLDLHVSAHLVSRVSLVIAAISFAIVLAAGVPVLFGYDSFVVTGGSMSPAIRQGALLISKRANPSDIHPGDVITFRRADRPTTAVTHRVVGVRHAEDGTPIFRTKGDANATADPQEVSADLPISRMAYTIPYAGYLLEFASTWPGKLILILLPAVGLVMLSLDAARRAVEARALESVQERRQRGATRRLARELPASPAASPSPSAGRARPRRAGPAGPGMLERVGAALTSLAHWRPARTEAQRAGALPRVGAGTRPRVRAGTQSRDRAGAAPRPRAVPDQPLEGGPAWVDRVAAGLSRQVAALEQIREQVLDETGPVARLLAEHDEVVEQLTANIDRKLGPLIEYADNLEADIEDLKARLGEENAEDVTAPLRPYFEEQRRRVVETRAQADRLRRPLDEYVRAQQQAIEAIFVPFEGEVRAMEDGLTDQVRVLKRMLSGIRSDQFETACEFIDERLVTLRALAEAGASDPASLAGTLQVPLGRVAELKRESLYLGPVLEALGAADARATAARAQERVVAEISAQDGVTRVEPHVA